MRTYFKSEQWRVLTAVLLIVVVAFGAWKLGVDAGRREGPAADMGASPIAAGSSVPPSVVDPSGWGIPQGEEATRRHIRDGLKAGDLDPTTGRRILNYHDPMVPGKNFDAPGKSPFMDMMLVPRYAGGSGAEGTDSSSIVVSPRVQQNLGIRTALVEQGRLDAEVVAVGNIAWNERDQTVVSSRAMGFVEKLHVRATFDRVVRGAPLLDVYVPDWVAAQEDYLALARMPAEGLDALREAALQRMRQAGMSEAQVASVVQERRLQARFTLHAPQPGLLTELQVREGATVTPGMPLLRIQGTARVWAEAEVPESQSSGLQAGLAVSATSPALPGQVFEGRLQALLPAVDLATRTLKARLELDNAEGRLVPGMLVQMRLARPNRKERLLVPSDAVIRTGRRNVVMLAEEAGRFRPVEVQVGLEVGDQAEITAGLQLGQRVVRSGQFLIDSEASLRGLEARLNPATAAASPSPAAAPAITHRTEATITEMKGETLTLDHPPIASLQWPAMVMGFQLPPGGSQLRELKVGDRVRVEFRLQDGDVPQITRLERVPAGAPR
jgi:Cu(I)/Ag(I) efflux system membrane fusion protein